MIRTILHSNEFAIGALAALLVSFILLLPYWVKLFKTIGECFKDTFNDWREDWCDFLRRHKDEERT